MDLKESFPSLGEYHEVVRDNFTQEEDILFQSKYAEKIGFSSWEDYIKYIYTSIRENIDIAKIENLVDIRFVEGENRTLSRYELIKCMNESEPNKEILKKKERLAVLPVEIKEKFQTNFYHLENLLMEAFIKKHDDPIKHKVIAAFTEDLREQEAVINAKDSADLNTVQRRLKASSLPNLNALLSKYTNHNYYFPEKGHVLKPLHDALVKEGKIIENGDFEKVFEKSHLPPSLKPIKWLGSTTELFYLLYRLNNSEEYFKGLSMDKIADRLFDFKKPKNSSSLRTLFSKALLKFNDESYIKKNLSEINLILHKLSV